MMSLFWVDNNMKISIFPVLDITRKTRYSRALNNLEDLPQKLNGNAVEFISLLKKLFHMCFKTCFLARNLMFNTFLHDSHFNIL